MVVGCSYTKKETKSEPSHETVVIDH